MARKPETLFRNKVVRFIKQLPNTFVMSIQQKSLRGHPDLLVCIYGVFVALELKASEKSPVSELQNFFLDRISEAGGLAWVVHPQNWESVQQALETLSRGIDEEKILFINQR